MNTKLHLGIFTFFVLLAIALPALAYDYPLSDEGVREAYMLGKSDGAKRDAFFANYTQHPPLPKTGPYIEMVQLETPFAVVVEHCAAAINYHAPDAAEEFVGKPGVFRVHVEIDLTESYGALVSSEDGVAHLRSPDFWRDFKIRLIQGKEIYARTVNGNPLYSYGDEVLTGAEVDLEYDAAKIKSDDATIEVVAPDGDDVMANFDLATLR
jgi:hypothetical protein